MAGTLLRPIDHEDRLSLVDHLTELRARLVVCVVTVLIAFGLCFWQEDAVLSIVGAPLAETQNLDRDERSGDPLEQAALFQREIGEAFTATAPALEGVAQALRGLEGAEGLSDGDQAALRASIAALERAQRQTAEAAAAVPRNLERQPVTLGVAEPFTTTLSVSFYAGLLLSMPVLLYQLFAFLLPAFSPREKRVALPIMLAFPFLFIGGVLFGYFVVLPRAIEFLQNFNDDSFDILVQARDYIRFNVFFLAALGLLFQVPIVVLAITRMGIVSPAQLRRNRGYVVLGTAVVAAVVTPTPDPITMLLSMAPMVVLFEASILLSAWLERIRPVEREPDDQPVETDH